MKAQAWLTLPLLIPLTIAGLFAGCTPPTSEAPAAGIPTVKVSLPLQRTITDYANYPGRTAAIEAVEVRARVNGYIDKINFKDGAEVDKDAIMYQIDPRPYQAALNQAQAQVALQQANLKYQTAVYNRNVQLAGMGQAVSQEELQQSLAQRSTSAAQVTAAEAAVEQARLNLGWTRVTAPISGRLGRTQITVGNLVVADQTLLTTIVSLDPMYAYFEADEQTVLTVQNLIREGKLASVRQGAKIPVYMGLTTEKGYPHEGYLDFVNNQVTSTTGTLQLRGVFKNPKPEVGDRILSPGLFVRIRVPISPPYSPLLVIQAAIGTDQNLKYVYVVDGDNKVVRREVQLGSQEGSLQVIQQGLQPNDRVIVDGIQKVHDGMVVKPREVPMPTGRTPPTSSSSSPGTQEPVSSTPRDASSMKENPAHTATKQ